MLAPEGGPLRPVECSRRVQDVVSAKIAARPWAGDVGTKGTIIVEERAAGTGPWLQVAVADVVNSVLKGWR